MKKTLLLLLLFSSASYISSAQLAVVPDSNYTQMVNNFILSGVTASNVQFTGATFSAGTFSGGSTTNLGMSDGIVLTTGMSDTSGGQPAIGDSVNLFKSFYCNTPGNAMLNQLIPGFFTFDAAVLEFDLVPAGNILEFQYVFASEEYPEFVGSSFNDVFGFFISGPNPAGGTYIDTNIATLPLSGDVVSINNVNATNHSNYFVDNQALNGGSIVFDGFTTVLMAQIQVTAGQSYHLTLAVADAGDGIFDSGVFLKAQSMKSYTITSVEDLLPPQCTLTANPISENTVLNIASENNTIKIQILDVSGRMVWNSQENVQDGRCSFSLGKAMSSLPGGIYITGISDQNGTSFLKIIKP